MQGGIIMKKKVVLCALTMASLMTLNMVYGAPACKNTCGGTGVSYPFGTSKGCGSKVFQKYVKCSKGKFLLITNTGQYEVVHIDYENRILIVTDKKMSTCAAMRRTTGNGFGLQEGTPFTVQGPHIVLLACTSQGSRVQKAPGDVCDLSGAQVCESLYGYCPSVRNLELSMNSAISSCCLLQEKAMGGGPTFGIDPGSYGCLSYTSIYRFGPGFGYGDNGFSSDYRNPNAWSYGIPLQYSFDEAAYSQDCHTCEASHGACAFDDDSTFVCVCPSGRNVSNQCPPGAQNNQASTRTIFLQAISIRGFAVVMYVIFVGVFSKITS